MIKTLAFHPVDIRQFLPRERPPVAVRTAIAKLPIMKFDKLEHVGSPDEHKPNSSLEGCLLSVSLHPEEWMVIARSLKGTTWALSLYKEKLRLIDFHGIKARARKNATRPSGESLLQLALQHGLVCKTKGYHISWYDDEAEDTRYIAITDREEAELEAQEEGRTMKVVDIHIATPKLEAYWMARHHESMGSQEADMAALAYLAEWCNFHHGIWWEDTYDPHNLSCPRGGLFQSTLHNLTITLTNGL